MLESNQRFWLRNRDVNEEVEKLSQSPSFMPNSYESTSSKRIEDAEEDSIPSFKCLNLGESDDDDLDFNDEGDVDDDDLYFERMHRKFEYEEKRIRTHEKESLVHDQYKLQERLESIKALDLMEKEHHKQNYFAPSGGISLVNRPLAYKLQQKLIYEDEKLLERYNQLLKSDKINRNSFNSQPFPLDVREINDLDSYDPSIVVKDLEERVFKYSQQSPLKVKLKISKSAKQLIAKQRKERKLSGSDNLYKLQQTFLSPNSNSNSNSYFNSIDNNINSGCALLNASISKLQFGSKYDKSSRRSHRSLVAFGVNIPKEINKYREFDLVSASDGWGIWSGVGQEHTAKKTWLEILNHRKQGIPYRVKNDKQVMIPSGYQPVIPKAIDEKYCNNNNSQYGDDKIRKIKRQRTPEPTMESDNGDEYV